jgi:hypothetical protein
MCELGDELREGSSVLVMKRVEKVNTVAMYLLNDMCVSLAVIISLPCQ